ALDPERRAGDALLDARALAIEARAALSVLPVDARSAARRAIRAARRAREADQRETADEALGVLRDARSGARRTARPYAPFVGTDDGIWSWLERLASGEDAAVHLARLVRSKLGAERAFVITIDGEDVESAAGVDLDDLEIAEAARRIDRDLLRRARLAGRPVYERD